jgi:hypothetical protein
MDSSQQTVSVMEKIYLEAEFYEDKTETWDYLGSSVDEAIESLSNEEKWNFYKENCQILDNFNLIAAVNQLITKFRMSTVLN